MAVSFLPPRPHPPPCLCPWSRPWSRFSACATPPPSMHLLLASFPHSPLPSWDLCATHILNHKRQDLQCLHRFWTRSHLLVSADGQSSALLSSLLISPSSLSLTSSRSSSFSSDEASMSELPWDKSDSLSLSSFGHSSSMQSAVVATSISQGQDSQLQGSLWKKMQFQGAIFLLPWQLWSVALPSKQKGAWLKPIWCCFGVSVASPSCSTESQWAGQYRINKILTALANSTVQMSDSCLVHDKVGFLRCSWHISCCWSCTAQKLEHVDVVTTQVKPVRYAALGKQFIRKRTGRRKEMYAPIKTN